MNAMTEIEPEKSIALGAPVDVTIENVAKDFGDSPALHGVSLDVRAGELVALLGPSGSGKTTLLRILAGLEAPSSGRVLFGGEDALGLPVQDRNIGFVFQHYALFRHMTVFDNIAFGLTVRPRRDRPPADEIRRRVLHLLDLVQLPGLAKRYPAQLSGGPASARGARPGARHRAPSAAARRAVRRARRAGAARPSPLAPRNPRPHRPYPPSSSPTTRKRRWNLPTESSSCPRAASSRSARPMTSMTDLQARSCSRSSANPRCFRSKSPDGAVLLDGEPTGLSFGEVGTRPATLGFRPHDVTLVTDEAPAIRGRIIAERRHGARRRLELQVGPRQLRAEIDVEIDAERPIGGLVAFRPERWRIFPA